MTKILVADKIAGAGVEKLRESGFEVVPGYDWTAEELLERVVDVSAIVVRSATTITREVIAAAPNLRAVGRAGVGVDNIDVDAATEHGVIVMNTPGGNTIATAELTFTHLLCSARPIAQANASMRAGKWEKKKFQGSELLDKTLGIFGLGRIGSEIAKRAKAFGMKVLAFDPYITEERAAALEVTAADKETIFREADFITVHMPKTAETAGMINRETIAMMKDGVRILNCARGGLIVEADLVEALESGKVAAVGLDVFEAEPLPDDSALRRFDNVVMTPHLGASTQEAQEGVGLQVAEAIVNVLKGGVPVNALNVPSVDPATLKMLMPYLKLGEKLGTVVQQISPDRVVCLTITYWGKLIQTDTLPLTRAIQRGYLKRITENVNDVNAPLCIKRKGIEVRTVKSNTDREYTDLVRVEAIDGDGVSYSVEGTLFGKTQRPRIVELNGREIEASLEGQLLIVENRDETGAVGRVGTILGEHRINIANMSLSRNTHGGLAMTLLELDDLPDDETLAAISAEDVVVRIHRVEL